MTEQQMRRKIRRARRELAMYQRVMPAHVVETFDEAGVRFQSAERLFNGEVKFSLDRRPLSIVNAGSGS